MGTIRPHSWRETVFSAGLRGPAARLPTAI